MRKLLIFLILLIMASPATAIEMEGKPDSTIVNGLVSRVFDEGFRWCTDAERISWRIDTTYVIRILDYAAEQTQKKFYIERDTFTVTVLGTYYYSLPSDFHDMPYERPEFGVTAIQKSSGQKEKGMRPMTVTQMDAYSSEDQPQRYMIREDQIYIEPVVQSGDTIKIYYAARSNTLDALTDTTNISRDYLDYMVYLAIETIYRAILLRDPAQDFLQKQVADFTILRTKEEARLAERKRSLFDLQGQNIPK